MRVDINATEYTNHVVAGSLAVTQNLTNQVDTVSFKVRKYGDRSLIPQFNDDLIIYDGAEKVFGGKVLQVTEEVESGGGGLLYTVQGVDHTYEADKIFISRVYQNETIADIIADMVDTINTALGTSFTSNHVTSSFVIEKIVFNQTPFSQCMKRLANILRYDWYIDPDKDVHFFEKFTTPAPFDLADTAGNYVYKSLVRLVDGSQVVNRVKVRGGEYNGASFTDTITVVGNDSKSFKLPYRFSNLQVELDTGSGFLSQTVGIDFIDDFTSKDVLYNFQEQMIRFENPLSEGDQIRFTGNPKVRVFAVAEDPDSIAQYGRIEKLIRDTSIESNTLARRRANAELYAYASTIVDARFTTRTPGLRTGMLLNLQSDKRDFDDQLLIKTITFQPLDPENFGYRVECISTKRFDLIELLQKILEPDPLPSDETEVAEDIAVMNETLQVQDEWTQINPFVVEEEVSVEDEWFANAVDPDDVRWVYGYYAPSGVTDTKRMGRYGRAKYQ